MEGHGTVFSSVLALRQVRATRAVAGEKRSDIVTQTLPDLIIKASQETDPGRVRTLLDEMLQHLRDRAPELWEVSADFDAILAGNPARCLVPRELTKLAIGMPLVFDGRILTMAGKPISMQVFREAIIPAKLPPVLYFGPWKEAGHYLCDRSGRHLYGDDAKRIGFKDHRLGLSKGLDPCYCPGWLPDGYKRSRPEIEGEAKLTHEAGLTILGVWDRSVDTRGGCHSTYIAIGTYDPETMTKLCTLAYERRWKLLADRVAVRIVEKEVL